MAIVILALVDEGLGLCSFGSGNRDDVNLSADFAWDRQFKVGSLAPVRVIVDNPSATIRGKLAFAWSNRAPQLLGEWGQRVWEMPVVLPEKSRRVYTAYVRGEEQNLHALLVSGGVRGRVQLSASKVMPGTLFLGVVGERPVAKLQDFWGRNKEGRPAAAVAFVRPGDLPDRWYGYSCLDALIWLGADPSFVKDPSAAAALKQWLIQGGRLVVSCSEAALLRGTFLEDLLPAKIEGDFAAPAAEALKSPGLKGRASFLKLGAGAHGFVAGGSLGRGKVSLVGYDLGREPFASWDAAPELWRSLIPLVTASGGAEPSQEEQNHDQTRAALGSQKLAACVREFPGVEPPSLSWALLLIGALALLVGPVDYAFLKLLHRLEWTWFTFPAMVGAATAVALWTQKSGPAFAQARQSAVADYYQEHDLSRAWSVLSLIEMRGRAFEVEALRPGSILHPVGYMKYFFGEGAGRESSIEMAEPWRIPEWALPRGATGTLLCEWCGSQRGVRFSKSLGGFTFENPFSLPVTNAVLIRNGELYPVGTIAPGKSSRIPGPLQKPPAKENAAEHPYYAKKFVAEEANLDPEFRDLILELSVSRTPCLGMAGDLRIGDYDGWVLVGTISDMPFFRLRPGVSSSRGVTVIRTFGSHD